jgi:hypothetical protein
MMVGDHGQLPHPYARYSTTRARSRLKGFGAQMRSLTLGQAPLFPSLLSSHRISSFLQLDAVEYFLCF